MTFSYLIQNNPLGTSFQLLIVYYSTSIKFFISFHIILFIHINLLQWYCRHNSIPQICQWCHVLSIYLWNFLSTVHAMLLLCAIYMTWWITVGHDFPGLETSQTEFRDLKITLPLDYFTDISGKVAIQTFLKDQCLTKFTVKIKN